MAKEKTPATGRIVPIEMIAIAANKKKMTVAERKILAYQIEVTRLQIENDKLLAMQEQNKQLERIANALWRPEDLNPGFAP